MAQPCCCAIMCFMWLFMHMFCSCIFSNRKGNLVFAFNLISVCLNKCAYEISDVALTCSWTFSPFCSKYKDMSHVLTFSIKNLRSKFWCVAACLSRDRHVGLSKAFYSVVWCELLHFVRPCRASWGRSSWATSSLTLSSLVGSSTASWAKRCSTETTPWPAGKAGAAFQTHFWQLISWALYPNKF